MIQVREAVRAAQAGAAEVRELRTVRVALASPLVGAPRSKPALHIAVSVQLL